MNSISEDVESDIVALHKGGKSRTEIKEITGVSLPTIRRVLRENNVEIMTDKFASDDYSEDQKKEICHRYETGEKPSSIADGMNLNRRGVLKYLRRHYEEAAQSWRQYPNIGPVEFISVWQTASSTQEVAKALGMTETAVRSRAYSYRKRGIELKKMNGDAYDWQALAKYASLFEDNNG